MNPSEGRTLLTATEFVDRVMSSIAQAPMPTPTRTFVAGMRAHALQDAAAALWVAWHLGTVRSWHVAPRVRVRSFALVLGVTSVLATGGLAAAAAVHSVVPQHDDRNPLTAPNGSSVDGPRPGMNAQTGTDEPDQTDDADPGPTTIDEPDKTDHTGGGAPVDPPADTDAGSNGVQPDVPDDHDDDHDSVDEDGPGHGDESDESNDGSDGDNGDESDESDDGDDGSNGHHRPAATDDHDSGNDGDEPDETNAPHDRSTDDDEPGEGDDGGSSGGDNEHGGDHSPASDSDWSGG